VVEGFTLLVNLTSEDSFIKGVAILLIASIVFRTFFPRTYFNRIITLVVIVVFVFLAVENALETVINIFK
jgi:type IV secretory pathway VirB2 component (pilin)